MSLPSSPVFSGLFDGGIAMLRRSMSAWVVPVKFWNPVMSPGGMPVRRMATRSARLGAGGPAL